MWKVGAPLEAEGKVRAWYGRLWSDAKTKLCGCRHFTKREATACAAKLGTRLNKEELR